MITPVMVAGKGLGTLALTVHPYPTKAEVIERAGDAYNRTRPPRRRRLFDQLMAWRR